MPQRPSHPGGAEPPKKMAHCARGRTRGVSLILFCPMLPQCQARASAPAGRGGRSFCLLNFSSVDKDMHSLFILAKIALTIHLLAPPSDSLLTR